MLHDFIDTRRPKCFRAAEQGVGKGEHPLDDFAETDSWFEMSARGKQPRGYF